MNILNRKHSQRMLAASMATTMLFSALPAAAAQDLKNNQTDAQTQKQNKDYVAADWKFDQKNGVSSGSIADGNLILKDQTGNGNDLKMQLYVNSQPTTDPKAANWEDYLSFSDDSMTGEGGSIVFNGDDGTKEKDKRNGADFITVDTAPINDETFQNGYTMEFLYHFPEDWTAADQWMSLIARQGENGGNSEGEQGTMYASVSNCKEIQFITGNAAGNHEMENAAWSVSMDEGGVWYHIAIQSDGHTISTYVNGCEAFRDYVSDDMDGMYADPADGRFRIGSSWWKEDSQTLDKFLQGGLQEVRISTKPLEKEDWLVPNPEKYVGSFGSNKSYELRNKDNYNIVFLPDTQNTVEYRPDVMTKAIDELIDQSDELNVGGVVSLGDVVDDHIDDKQYVNAIDAFYRLPDAGMKFLIQLGNHDGSEESAPNAHNYQNSFSGKSAEWTRRTDSYLTHSPNHDGNSSYMFLQEGSYNYLVIALSSVGNDSTAWDPADEAWLRSVLEKYPNSPTIITSHDLQNCSDTNPSEIKLSAQGKKLWEIVKDYDQVFMLAGGHSHGSGVEVLTNTNGKPVLSILTDLQFAYNGGNGWFRYVEFDESANKIYYSVYSPYVASLKDNEKSFFDVNFLTGTGHEGEFDFNFKERFPNMETTHTSKPESKPENTPESKPEGKPESKPASTLPFTDVSTDAAYYHAMEWAAAQKIALGTSAATFDPERPCTRADLATFLWRAAGSPAPKQTTHPFSDLPADAYYANAARWAAENGILSDASADAFRPHAPVTVGEVMTLLGSSAASAPDTICTRAQAITQLYQRTQKSK